MSDVPNMGEPSDGSQKELVATPPGDSAPGAGDSPVVEDSGALADAPGSDPLAMPGVDQEVADAMASMNPSDLAELCGQVSTGGTKDTFADDDVARGTKLVGTVVGVSDEEVFLEFGAKLQGVLPKSQLKDGESTDKGAHIEVVADRLDRESGLLTVYREGAVQRASWENLEPGMIVRGRVTGMIKGGLEVNINGLRAFMPHSQASLTPMKDESVLLNETLRFEVMEVNARGKSLLISRRKLLERERREKCDELLRELEVGQVRKGIVGNLTEFGAFVDLGGVDGLVHKRDLSWGMVENVADVLKPGQEIEVQVLKIEKKRQRISLGFKQVQPNPWVGAEERYPAGSQHKVRVLRLASFGAFAELESGVEALIPISEMSWSRSKGPGDAASVGDVVDVVVLRTEESKQRIAVSMKQAQADPWADVLESFPEKSLTKGTVTRLTDFGAFVEIAPSVEGLIHISELAEGRVRNCAEVVETGQIVETRVLGVDLENRRISLSIRAVHAAEAQPESDAAAQAPKPPKKRKTALRGGLSSHFDW